MWATLLLKIVEVLARLGIKKKQNNDAEHRKALEKTVESGNESRKVEKEIRDEHKEVDKKPSDVEAPDGGLNFDDWNAGG